MIRYKATLISPQLLPPFTEPLRPPALVWERLFNLGAHGIATIIMPNKYNILGIHRKYKKRRWAGVMKIAFNASGERGRASRNASLATSQCRIIHTNRAGTFSELAQRNIHSPLALVILIAEQ